MANERIQAILTKLQDVLDTVTGKQDKLTAGDNITINNNRISADAGGLKYVDKDDVTYKITEIHFVDNTPFLHFEEVTE